MLRDQYRELEGKNLSALRKIRPCVISSITNTTWSILGLSPGLHTEVLLTNQAIASTVMINKKIW
jgi:hypothetical protein